MGLKVRLMLAFSSVLIVVIMTAAVFFIRGAREDVRQEMQSTQRLVEHFLDFELRALAAHWPMGAQVPFDLAALSMIRHLRVEFFDAQGRRIETSQPLSSPNAPKVPAWFAALASPQRANLLPVRRPLIVNGEMLGELVITPEPMSEYAEKWQDTKELLEFSILLFIAVNAVLYLVVARSLRPVDRILAALAQMEDGNLQARLPVFTLPEFGKIGARFNRMADALQQGAQQNQRLTLKLMQAQEDEQKRLARELHDELGQCLTAIQADAAAILRHGEHRSAPVRASANAIVDVTQRMMTSIRGMLHRLRPDILDAFGLAAALRELIDDWRRRHPGIACGLSLEDNIAAPGEETSVALYRSVQEALTNVARHSHATHVEIGLRSAAAGDGERLVLSICDDGRGAAPGQTACGFGLLGIRERALALGGTLAILRDAGQGFHIQIELPAKRHTATA